MLLWVLRERGCGKSAGEERALIRAKTLVPETALVPENAEKRASGEEQRARNIYKKYKKLPEKPKPPTLHTLLVYKSSAYRTSGRE